MSAAAAAESRPIRGGATADWTGRRLERASCLGLVGSGPKGETTDSRQGDGRNREGERERELASHVCGDWSTGKGAAAGDMSSFFPGERERQLPRSRKRELVMCTRSES